MNEKTSSERSLLSLILITYKQRQTAAGSFAELERPVSADSGPHRVVVNRNLGIGGNLSSAFSLSSGGMLVVAAGDDLPCVIGVGLSRWGRALSAQHAIRRLLSNNGHALVEMPLLQKGARAAGCQHVVGDWLASEVSWTKRLRTLIYAAWPWALAPFFPVKRLLARAG